MSSQGVKFAALAVALAAAAVSAEPLFTFLAADRYIEGWADGPFCQPPQFAYDRMDATGLDDASLNLTVGVTDDFGDGVSVNVAQASVLFRHGFSVNGHAEGDEGPPAGSSTGSTHSFFSVQFQTRLDVFMPLVISIVDDYEGLDASVDLVGPGVDIHLSSVGYPPSLQYENWSVPISAFETYTFTMDVHAYGPASSVSTYVDFWVPAPGTAIALGFGLPALIRRRR